MELPAQPTPAPPPPALPIVPHPRTIAPGRFAGVMLLYAARKSVMTAVAAALLKTVFPFTIGAVPPQPGSNTALHVKVGSSTKSPFTVPPAAVVVIPAAAAIPNGVANPRFTGARPVAAAAAVLKVHVKVQPGGKPAALVTVPWIIAV